jgi:hypothetical protein
MFDKSKKNENSLLLNRIKSLEETVKRKPTDDINEARSALAKCTEYKNKSYGTLEEINSLKENINNLFDSINKINDTSITFEDNIKNANELSISTLERINELEDKISEFETLYSEIEDLKERNTELDKIYQNTNELFNKTNAIHSSIKLIKNDFDELSYEIFGFEDEEEKHQEGLKDKLQKVYTSLSGELKTLKTSFDEMKTENKVSLDNLYDANKKEFEKFISDKELIYSSIVKEIKDLLPQALTVGLSYAYSEKRENEIKENEKLVKSFNLSIFFLVLISLIPFGVSTYLLFQGESLKSTIEYLPRLILSIAPLYAPVVWLAYYSNKKLNLSKRLIEEYTHKEVLSKTFEGLSKQIESLPDSESSNDLRTKLLYNILTVSSENPGKLISDYNTSDHPLMDALNKSVKLNDAIEAISKIPGMSKLSNIIEKKANEILDEQEKKVNKGLEQIEKES